MSANNWGYCPKCVMESRLVKSVLPGTCYTASNPDLSPLITLREEYEFYMDPETGVLFIEYRAKCKHAKCDYAFQHTERVKTLG